MRLCLSVVHSLLSGSSIPWHEYAVVCLSITTTDEHSGCFQFGTI